MKTFSIIAIMFFMGVNLVWGQPEERVHNYYAGKNSVDDGFGGVWDIQLFKEKYFKGYITYYLRRESNSYPGNQNDFHNDRRSQLPLLENSKSVREAVERAFCAYLWPLSWALNDLQIHLWVDPVSGKIKEVGYVFFFVEEYPYIYLTVDIPPKRFTRLERILKRTVRFDVSGLKFTEDEKEYGYCVHFSVDLPDDSYIYHYRFIKGIPIKQL